MKNIDYFSLFNRITLCIIFKPKQMKKVNYLILIISLLFFISCNKEWKKCDNIYIRGSDTLTIDNRDYGKSFVFKRGNTKYSFTKDEKKIAIFVFDNYYKYSIYRDVEDPYNAIYHSRKTGEIKLKKSFNSSTWSISEDIYNKNLLKIIKKEDKYVIENINIPLAPKWIKWDFPINIENFFDEDL